MRTGCPVVCDATRRPLRSAAEGPHVSSDMLLFLGETWQSQSRQNSLIHMQSKRWRPNMHVWLPGTVGPPCPTPPNPRSIPLGVKPRSQRLRLDPLDELREELYQSSDFFIPLFPLPDFVASLCACRFSFFLLFFSFFFFSFHCSFKQLAP